MADTLPDLPPDVDLRARAREAWQAERDLADERTARLIDAHTRSADHLRPRGLVTLHFDWDSGTAGVALTAEPTRPTPWMLVPFPAIIQEARVQGYPSGSATITVIAAGPTVATSGATSIVASALPTLTSSTESIPDETLTGWTTTIGAGTRLAAYLTTVSTCERVSLNLELRRS